MLQSFSLRQFRAHRSLKLDLGRLTVVVGPNASGKTSILEGLRLLSRLCREMGNDVLVGSNHPTLLRTRGVEGAIVLSAAGKWNETEGCVEFVVKPDREPPTLQPHTWNYSPSAKFGTAEERGMPLASGMPELNAGLGASRLLHLDSRRLAEPCYSDRTIPSLEDDGAGLASVLSFLKLTREAEFDQIEASLAKLVPRFKRIRFDRTPIERNYLETVVVDGEKIFRPRTEKPIGDRISLDMQGASDVPANAAGEGTILALGLLTALLGPDQPRLLLLDDIELGLHPMAQQRLVELLRELLQRFPQLQIVATSHSPFVLDFLEPDEVWLTAVGDDGASRCRSLVEHPEFSTWKKLMRPGEFWSSVGEQWVLDLDTKAQPDV